MDIDKKQLKKTLKNWRFWVIIFPVSISLLVQVMLEIVAGIFEFAYRVLERSAHYVAYNKPIKRIIDWWLDNQ